MRLPSKPILLDLKLWVSQSGAVDVILRVPDLAPDSGRMTPTAEVLLREVPREYLTGSPYVLLHLALASLMARHDRGVAELIEQEWGVALPFVN